MKALLKNIHWSVHSTVFLALIIALSFAWQYWIYRPRAPIKIGILHSTTGTMAISEKSLVDAVEMAIDEINANGGLLDGRMVVAVIADGKSDPDTFAREADRLIVEEKVCTVFGCWTSASRKTAREVFERRDHLLFYPVQYEGLEQSPNIVYTGATPNQQIIPSVRWGLINVGKRFFLVGSDYVFPRTANAVTREYIERWRGQIVGEEYIPLGSTNVTEMVKKIVAAKPDIILNTINGDSNLAFFKALRKAGVTADKIPTISYSISEEELSHLDPDLVVGDYAAWNYFQSVDRGYNQDFVKRFKDKYGPARVTTDPIEASYFGVHLWAAAVEQAGSINPKAIREALPDQSVRAPGGMVYIDPETLHTWKIARLGRIRDDGQFDIVWDSGTPVRPIPFPEHRTRKEWEAMLESLYQGWGGQWQAPTK
ncbi:MAG: urea transport system substrate-binding protein [Limisphaerales bacterium]|jgi:urea transport system substrate-binding protein